MTKTTSYTCTHCGAARDATEVLATPPLPCECGSTACTAELRATMGGTAGLDARSGYCTRKGLPTASERFREIEEALSRIRSPFLSQPGTAEVQLRQQEIRGFFVSCHNLKDTLRKSELWLNHGKAHGNPCERAVEDAITTNPALALVADLANTEKHNGLNKRTRSGHPPTFESISVNATKSNLWEMSLNIVHGTTQVDAITVAAKAVEEWRGLLKIWRVI